jgi:hypothetical protein
VSASSNPAADLGWILVRITGGSAHERLTRILEDFDRGIARRPSRGSKLNTKRSIHARLRSISLALLIAVPVAGTWSCTRSAGGFSGRYEVDFGGGSAVLDFKGVNKVNVSLVSGKEEMTHHCVYAIADDKMMITTDEPMGVPMNLIIDGDVLKDGGGTVYKRK